MHPVPRLSAIRLRRILRRSGTENERYANRRRPNVSIDLVAYVREKLLTTLVVSDPSNRDLLEIVSPRTP